MWRLILIVVLVCRPSWAGDGTALIDIEGVYELECMVAFVDGVPSIDLEHGWFVIGRSGLFILYSGDGDLGIVKLPILASDGSDGSVSALCAESEEDTGTRLRARFDVQESTATFTFVGHSDGSEYRTVCKLARLSDVPPRLSKRVDSRLKLLSDLADSSQEKRSARELQRLFKKLGTP